MQVVPKSDAAAALARLVADALPGRRGFDSWRALLRAHATLIRRLGSAPDVMLGSVHAVTETGTLVTASMGGSQLGPYASGAGRVILVVGTQKIVADLDDAFRRIEEYAFPLVADLLQRRLKSGCLATANGEIMQLG